MRTAMRHTVVIGLLSLAAPAWSAADQPTLRVETGRGQDGFPLAGRDARQQLLVSAGERDLTRSVSYETVPPGIVRVDATGLVSPLREGKADIHVRGAGGTTASVAVTVTHLAEDLPVNFDNQVVP